jgi:GNAT superfamily N-acetyltransferase
MPSYRFCRPDDIPRLIAAIDACYRPHVPGEPPMTVERFRTEMKELSLWPSSCLLAREGDGAVAVLIATKRPEASSILRIGVLPGYERQGHGAHLLTSLSQKLAVLGPERLVVQLPRDRPDLHAFFAAVDYTREVPLTDWLRKVQPARPVPAELIQPISTQDADRHGLLAAAGPDRAWERQRSTLLARGGRLGGVAIVTPERVEACVLFDDQGDGVVDLWFAHSLDPSRQHTYLPLLFRHLAGLFPHHCLRLPRLHPGELSEELLIAQRFTPSATYHRWAAVATPG